MKDKKIGFWQLPSSKIISRYIITSLITFILVCCTLPTLLNYPPESINTDFDVMMSGISFTSQISIATVSVIILLLVVFKWLFAPIDKWFTDSSKRKYSDIKRINMIRKKCLSLPYIIFLVELFIPIFGTIFILSVTNGHSFTMIFKVLMLLISFFFFFSSISYISSKSIFNQILRETYTDKVDIGGLWVPLKQKILIQILPISVMGVLLTSLIAYSQVVKAKEQDLFDYYHNELVSNFNGEFDSGELIMKFSELKLSNIGDSKFIIEPDGDVVTISGYDPSEFVIKYTELISDRYDGRTYDGYGIDTQGATIKVETEEGTYTLGILFTAEASEALMFLCIDFLFVVFVTFFLLELFSNSLSNDISTVTNSLERIADPNNAMRRLPIISNDELSDLAIAYNKVQDISAHNIKQIRDNQDLLVERERLASLGQMVGGIAHNLKTPIMSIAGAAEGLNQLVRELDMSIGNPVVNDDDYHAIAKDMSEWVEKIKTHAAYMSDVITVVKGQTVTFSDSQIYDFSVTTLFKQVDILMKHELKSNLTILRFDNNVPNDVKISGNINSLVQVLNNMISNAIQAYGGKENQFIDLSANLRDNNFVEIIVRDYGPGLPDVVKENLFKKMVTTKGKAGTGLGMFMSYSNIKAHFKGNISFETAKNKGTSFIITIPINNKGV